MRNKLNRYTAERKKHMLNTIFNDSPVIKSGNIFSGEYANKGLYFRDISGNVFLDFTAQISILNVGFNNRFVAEFIRGELAHLSGCISNDWQFQNFIEVYEKEYEISPVALARKIKKLIPWEGNWKIGFEVSGATAINQAIKLCLKNAPEKQHFIAFEHAFHGRHGYALDLSSSKEIHKSDFPEAIRVERWSYDMLYNKEAVRNVLTGAFQNKINGIIFEPIQGEGGINVMPSPSLKLALDIVRENGIFIIADEIQTFCRTGKYFACEHYDFKPDILLISKSIGGGLPISAMIADMDRLKDFPLGAHGGTFHAVPLAVAAAIGVLEYIKKERLLKNAAKMGRYLEEKLDEIKNSYPAIIKEAKGIGLMQGLDIINKETRDKIIKKCLRARPIALLLAPAGEKTIRFTPALTVNKFLIDQAVAILDNVLKKI